MNDNIENFLGYHVTRNGRIFSRRCMGCLGKFCDSWKEMKIQINKQNRATIFLRDIYGKYYRLAIHRLVLLAYVGKCPIGMEGCHNDGNSLNNAVENLRWDTHKNNGNDMKKHNHSPRGEKNGASKLNQNDIKRIKEIYQNKELTQYQIAKIYKVRQPAISRIIKGIRWKHVN